MEDKFHSCTYLSFVRRYHPNPIRCQVLQSSASHIVVQQFPQVSLNSFHFSHIKERRAAAFSLVLTKHRMENNREVLIRKLFPAYHHISWKKTGEYQHCNVLHSGLIDLGNSCQIKRESCVDKHAFGPQDNSPTDITACVAGSSLIKYCLHYILMQLKVQLFSHMAMALQYQVFLEKKNCE